ncbi:unnamed protein product [Gulo gulo]|uniref:Uncharacterized protein n=1 Tax=Gulo gulo TaxID=48420 RepID=A0A9X9LGD4_GULGU|nr:unnamed protein product [Gulo gulo]
MLFPCRHQVAQRRGFRYTQDWALPWPTTMAEEGGAENHPHPQGPGI